jgi:serine/threonine protein phosphatase 1
MDFGPSFLERGRVYAIGDIHGRSDLLDRIVTAIRSDLEANPVENCVTVTLGDYFDRGPDSRGVIERLLSNPFPSEFIPLKGNHELLFESFLRQPAVAEHWRRLGGLETLASYGVPVQLLMRGQSYRQAAEALKAAVPQAHLNFVSSLRTSLSIGPYFLCHAGVRPGVPLDRQSEDDLLWIREPFLASGVNFGKIVVHGHTPTEQPEVLANRINVDTGAYVTNKLTCVALGKQAPRFLSTSR